MVSEFGRVAVLEPALPDEITKYLTHGTQKLRMKLSSEHRTLTDDVTGHQSRPYNVHQPTYSCYTDMLL
jgi:hypothetical protein